MLHALMQLVYIYIYSYVEFIASAMHLSCVVEATRQ